MVSIPDKSIDMILCDLPYGTTSCKWDSVIPFDKLWEAYKRIIKDDGAIVLFGSEPFATELRHSNLKMYKYDWYWRKPNVTNFANAKKQPLRCVETISVFSKKQSRYFPQGLKVLNKKCKNGKSVGGETLRTDIDKSSGKGKLRTEGYEYVQQFTNYPKQIFEFQHDKEKLHPTQKPIALCEYLIKTYTNENDIVLDNCMGSGSTGVACINTNRRFIGIELDDTYFKTAEERIKGEMNNEFL